MELFDYLFAKKKGGGGGSSSDVDWSAIGYDAPPQNIVDDYDYSKSIYDSWIAQTSLRLKFQNDLDLVYMPLVDTNITTDMAGMFLGCLNLINIPLLDTSNVTDMSNMIRMCNKITTIPLLNTSNVTDMSNMFFSSYSIEEIPLLDTSKVVNMSQMFYNCSGLKNVPILDTSSVTNMSYMFSGCSLLTDESLDNILQMCIGATSYTGTKTLGTLGISFSSSRLQSLPHYQNFISAGWSL